MSDNQPGVRCALPISYLEFVVELTWFAKRIFASGTLADYFLQALGILAACGSGGALALVNLVLGDFISLLSGVGSGQGVPDDFMEQVTKRSYDIKS